MMYSRITVLRFILALLGLAVLVFMLWEPHLEGRNAHATLFQIYFHDPFLAYVYIASTPFFVGLVQLWKITGFAQRGRWLSDDTANALRMVKRCAFILIALIAIGELFILMSDSDDRAGGVAMGVFFSIITLAAAVTAKYKEKAVRDRIGLPLTIEVK